MIVVPYHLEDPAALPLPGLVIQAPEPSADGPWERLAALYESVAVAVAASEAPVVASADCTTSLGVLAGLQRSGLDPGIVWFDAHGDFNTAETTPSGYLGGMPLALAVGRGDRTAPDALGLRPVAEDRVLLADARDLDPGERAALDASAVRRLPVGRIGAGELPDGPLYLHIDLDVLEPDALPGLRYPVPGGVPESDLLAALRVVGGSGRVAAVGLGCTWVPDRVDPTRATEVVTAVLDAITAE